MTEMRQSLERELRKEHREIKTSLDFMNKAFEDMANQLKKVETENAELKAANRSLTDECAPLRNKVTENELRITELEQYSRNRNIKGVPTTQNENLKRVLAAIGNAVNEAVSESDIEACVYQHGTLHDRILYCSFRAAQNEMPCLKKHDRNV
ncbi:hypothetical protein HPB50_017297 [Hyalomma asiaticum]|uniref:Uncharacterized protein n=1 Tax=Hyalomma asiaticum TaxID=266040 RepID=A0ACB7RJ58_HYAAI|nr:hypothetical protein HPB50_017297 [Hyalomma asiaticum]